MIKIIIIILYENCYAIVKIYNNVKFMLNFLLSKKRFKKNIKS